MSTSCGHDIRISHSHRLFLILRVYELAMNLDGLKSPTLKALFPAFELGATVAAMFDQRRLLRVHTNHMNIVRWKNPKL